MKKKKIEIGYLLFSLFIIFLNLENIYSSHWKILNLFQWDFIVINLLIIFFIFWILKIKPLPLTKMQKWLCLLLSLFSVFGNSYLKIGSWNLVFGNFLIFFLAVLKIISFTYFYQFFLGYVNGLLETDFHSKHFKKHPIIIKFLDTFQKHPFLVSFLIMILFWLIYIIAFYPIILSPDPSFQIKQYFNEHTKYIDWVIQINENVNMTTHHPVIHTYLLGICIQIGRVLINDNFGLFIYSFLQIITLASVLAYTISFSFKHSVSRKWCILLLLIYSLVPMFPLYAMSGVKDTYYTSFIILYVLFIFDMVTSYKNSKISWKYVIYITLVSFLIILFRNNGIYVIVLTFPLLILFTHPNRRKFILILVLLLGGNQLYNKVLIPSLGISEGSIREVLSIPFQQTARYVTYHDKELTNNQRKQIDAIIGYEDLKERYDPEKADPVKNNYNKYTTTEELVSYLKEVWLDGLMKHPTTYIEATINNTYGYFYPNSMKWYIYHKYDNRITENNLVDYHYNSLSSIRNILSKNAIIYPYYPVVGLLSNIGFSTWILFLLAVYVIDRKKKEYLMVLSPLLVTLLVCVASPVNTYFRYAMPYVFMIPVLIGLIVSNTKKATTK